MPLRVLVVDDAIMCRILLKEMLESLGHTMVAEAETGAAAIEQFSASKPDLVTLDISLPDMDGMAVLREIRLSNPKAKVILISGNDQDKIVAQARAIGAIGLLVKPFQREQLEAVLKKAESGH
ncbi:MAG: response regulator [Elusimicrobia bacterium]|nr:response regulator [Elusimicrobiota bacterium]